MPRKRSKKVQVSSSEEEEDLSSSSSEQEEPLSGESGSEESEESSETETETKTESTPPIEEQEDPGKRYFKILIESIRPEKGSPKVAPEDLSANGGRYAGKNPMQAAKKAFTRISKAGKKKGTCAYVFSIQETTQGSAKKVFTYRGERRQLEKPQAITKGDTQYFIRFSSEVRSYKPGGKAKKTRKK